MRLTFHELTTVEPEPVHGGRAKTRGLLIQVSQRPVSVRPRNRHIRKRGSQSRRRRVVITGCERLPSAEEKRPMHHSVTRNMRFVYMVAQRGEDVKVGYNVARALDVGDRTAGAAPAANTCVL